MRGPTGEQEVVGVGSWREKGAQERAEHSQGLHGQGTKEELLGKPPTTPANRAGSGTGFQVPAENGAWADGLATGSPSS